MEQGRIDRRRGRRTDMEAQLLIRRVKEGSRSLQEEQNMAKNVSLHGVYFETHGQQDAYTVDDMVIASLSIPESRTRDFPFSLLAGRGRVVRVEELSGAESDVSKRFGVALEFCDNLTALTAIPPQG